MASNLDSPHRYNPSFIEGYVLSVDPIRFTCSVRTINKKILANVPWLIPSGGFSETGMHITPNVQDRVLVSTMLGYPLILGCIPRIGTYGGEITSATGAEATIDIGSDSDVSGAASLNPSKPSDLVPGDFMYTARGGSLIAVLSSGLAILRASTMSQIIMSKFEGLVRLVTRNYQRFSDASSNVSTNMRGRLYEWFGADWAISNNQTNQERYNEVYGDVAAGEVLRGAPAPSVTLPNADTRVRKQWLKDASGNAITIETLYQDGSITFVVQNWNSTPAIVNSNTTTNSNASSETSVTDGTNTSSITITPTSLVVTNNNKATGTFGASSVVISYDNKAEVTLTDTNAIMEYNNKSKVTLTDTSAVIDYNGTSKGTFDSSQASITSGGHFCTVTASGVALG